MRFLGTKELNFKGEQSPHSLFEMLRTKIGHPLRHPIVNKSKKKWNHLNKPTCASTNSEQKVGSWVALTEPVEV